MRGKPFEPGNKLGKGRPPGSKNKKTIFQEALESHGEAIIKTAELQALKGDQKCLQLCMERLVPIAKAPNSRFRLPPMLTVSDLVKAVPAVMRQVALGRLTAQEGEAISRSMDSYLRMRESVDFEARLRLLETQREDRPEASDDSEDDPDLEPS
jgi:hypothetical protein